MSWRAGGQLQMTTGAPPARSNSPGASSSRSRYSAGRTLAVRAGPSGGRSAIDEPPGALFATDVLQSRTQILSKLDLLPRFRSWTGRTRRCPRGCGGYYTHVPTDLSDRVKKLAQGWQAAAHIRTKTWSDAARQYFRRGGFTYTLNPGLLPPEGRARLFPVHLTAGILRALRGGVQHADARSRACPARVVVGYQGGEFNSWGGYYPCINRMPTRGARSGSRAKAGSAKTPRPSSRRTGSASGAENYAALWR